ncbi:MAG: hypothetical protein IPF58_14625 [Saprospirales bacterium]|nr:hypothetical protein [Saprospirales bacterium]
MKSKYKIIAFSIITLFIFSCNEKEEKECCKKDKNKTEEVVENETTSNESIFNLESKWIKQNKDSRFVEFSTDHQLNDNWTCISSNNDATMEIANVLNVRVKPLADGGFDHSNTIHLIDKNGNIVFQQNGLAQEPTEMIEKIKTLIK